MKVRKVSQAIIAVIVMVCAVATDAVADIAAPGPKSSDIDWSFVLMGVVSAFLGALLFIWLGRKLFKRT